MFYHINQIINAGYYTSALVCWGLIFAAVLGVGGALSSVVVFGLFISSHETQERYGSPDLLWLVAFGLIYWLARLWIKTSRGEMDDDPVVYAIKDRGSRIVIFCLFSVMIFAHSINIRLAP